MPAIIVVNDESAFQDVPGITYEYGRPHAVTLLQPNQRVIFYTGGRRSGVKNPRVSPLSNKAHYFAFGIIGEVQVPATPGGLYRCTFSEYSPFARPVMLHDEHSNYLEPVVPSTNVRGYFQNGVREVEEAVFTTILRLAGNSFDPDKQDDEQSPNVETGLEGGRIRVLTNRIERDRALRDRAIQIHGLTCMACEFNFGLFYGDHAKGYIHVHHLALLAGFGDRRTVNPVTDLTVLCANCHCVVHRYRNQMLSIEQLRQMIKVAREGRE